MKRVCVGFLLLLVGFLAGCDDSPAVPQAVLETANKAQSDIPKRPTTQELLSPTRKQLMLGSLPLTMKVPESWHIITPGNTTLLHGYTPSGGEVDIQLTSRNSIKQEDLDRMVAGAKKEQEAKKDSILKADLRNFGSAKLFERQAVGAPGPLTTFDEHNNPVTRTESLFKWTVTVYQPSAGAFQVYEMNMIGLTKTQYDQDKEFLNGILDTLALGNATTAPSTVATPTTAP